jgi:hypothetical protein
MNAHPAFTPKRLLPAVLAALLCGSALAGRPLVVDDANTNDAGNGQVEAWLTRVEGINVFTIAPAYAPIDGLELGAAFARESSTSTNASALQLKWRITASKEDGCNVGAVVGYSRVSGAGNASYLNGLLTCNFGDAGSAHLNLGATKPSGASAATGWGVAYEREFGALTPHIEWFGAEGGKPTVQVGLRGDVAKNVQLDGSVGRGGGVNVYSLGLKFSF